MVRRWLASMKLQKQKWGVARTMFLGRIYASRWRKNAQQLSKIKGPNKNLPLVTNKADSKQAEKQQQRTCADFTQVMSHFINHVLYLFFVVIWIWTCWNSAGSQPSGSAGFQPAGSQPAGSGSAGLGSGSGP